MPLYVYEDLKTGELFESPTHGLDKAGNVKRCWKAEGVNIGPAVGSIKRDSHADSNRDLFLPTRKDFEKKYGPGADKAIKEWNDNHDNPADKTGRFRPK